jgi:hypothetical protein
MSDVIVKWCNYCQKNNHNDSECWSTRPAGWIDALKTGNIIMPSNVSSAETFNIPAFLRKTAK